MICIGHRGAAGHEPENTLRSVRKALELGAPWVEIDVYAVEGKLIVFHDDRLDRTTNGKGPILEQSLDYLRSLDAGNGEKIPTLDEVLDLLNCKAGINIELKGPDTAALAVAQIKARLLNGWAYEQFLVSSFDHPQLETVSSLDPKIRIGVLYEKVRSSYADFAESLNAYSVNVSHKYLNADLVREAHSLGLKVFAYTVNSSHDIERMQRLGVDGVFSDYPDRVLGRAQ